MNPTTVQENTVSYWRPQRAILPLLFVAAILALVAAGVWASDELDIAGYHDYNYGDEVKDEPTAESSQSKLWWNDGRWWGILWNPTATPSPTYQIYWLDQATPQWVTTGIDVDDRPDSRSDVLWDGTTLYIASHIEQDNPGYNAGPEDQARLYRFSYNSGTDTYSPVNPTGVISNFRTRTLVIDKDETGRLWATYVTRPQGGSDYKVHISYSTTDGATWSDPVPLENAGVNALAAQVQRQDISALAVFEDATEQHIGVMWSNQLTTTNPLTSSFYLATLPVSGDPEADWNIEGGFNTAFPHPGDNHINLATTPAGELLATVKTNETAPAEAPLIAFIARQSDGGFITDTVSPVASGDTRPSIVVDSSANEAYVFVVSQAGGGQVCYSKSDVVPLTDVNFPGDNCQSPAIREITAIVMADMPVAIGSTTYTHINNPTTNKGMVTEQSGVAVLASDEGDNTTPRNDYFHNVLGDPVIPPTPTDVPGTPTPTATSTGEPPTLTATATGEPPPPTATATATSEPPPVGDTDLYLPAIRRP